MKLTEAGAEVASRGGTAPEGGMGLFPLQAAASLAGPGHSPFSPRPGTGSDDKWLRNDDRERLRTVGQGRGRGAGGEEDKRKKQGERE